MAAVVIHNCVPGLEVAMCLETVGGILELAGLLIGSVGLLGQSRARAVENQLHVALVELTNPTWHWSRLRHLRVWLWAHYSSLVSKRTLTLFYAAWAIVAAVLICGNIQVDWSYAKQISSLPAPRAIAAVLLITMLFVGWFVVFVLGALNEPQTAQFVFRLFSLPAYLLYGCFSLFLGTLMVVALMGSGIVVLLTFILIQVASSPYRLVERITSKYDLDSSLGFLGYAVAAIGILLQLLSRGS